MKFVTVYDRDSDCALSIEEFIQAITPETKKGADDELSEEALKQTAEQILKETSYSARRVALPFEVEFSL
jgi:Ca2+-binding EF-hand superfamily protein